MYSSYAVTQARCNVFYRYVDTRGIWPIFVRGQIGVKLEGKPRDISVDDAEVVADKLLAESTTLRQ
jgi:hypothetical protein